MKQQLVAIKFRLSKLDEAKQNRLLSYLPKEDASFVNKLPSLQAIPSISFTSEQELLDRIHPSWTQPREQVTSLIGKKCVGKLLLKELDLPLPPQFISKGPLDFLLEAPTERLMKVCRFLGLYDVSLEIKKIIHSRQIKKIEAALSEEEIIFLNERKKDRHPIAFIEIGLLHWDGDVENLQQVILGRGLNRMAKALSDVGGTFLWYLAHRLPREEGTKLLRFHKNLKDQKIIDILIKQVEATYVYTQAP